MKVTNLKFTRRGNRVSVFIDDKFALSLEKNLIVDLGIHKEQEVAKKDIQLWEMRDLEERLYGKVINLVAKRPRSENEIYLYLQRKLYRSKKRDEVIQEIITRLKEKGYIDDYKFTFWWINSRMLYKPRGEFLIIQELRQKGINRDIISEALEKIGLDSRKEMKYALDLGRKKKRTLGNLLNERNKKRFFNYLSRKGFGYSTVKKVYEKLK